MRMPPRTGTVCKLSGNRRKPWVAKVFVGYNVNDETKTARAAYRSIGTFAKKSEAMKALMQYTVNPQEKAEKLTLEDVYNEWSVKKYPEISANMQKNYVNAWKYLTPLHRMRIADLTTSDFEATVEKTNTPRTVKSFVQTIISQLYKYAIAHDYAQKDISAYTNFHTDSKSRIQRKVFTPEEVETLFTSDNVKDRMILAGIYTGMRPNEIIGLTVSEVDLENGFLRIHGSKTESGLFRDVPIHPDILPIITAELERGRKFKATAVFVGKTGKKVAYDTYYQYVTASGHTPHDTRHSFATYARRSNLDPLATKRIMGHASGRDVTEDIYTHTDDDFLQAEMEKFKIE